MDITKIANFILYMIEKNTAQINDKKVSLLLFLIDFESQEKSGTKIFHLEYIKKPRNPDPKILSEIFQTIANEEDIEEDDPKLYFIQELLDFIDIEIVKKQKYTELQFIKYEEEFDSSLFTKKEFLLIDKLLEKYKDASTRKLANDCFKIEKVRETQNGDIII